MSTTPTGEAEQELAPEAEQERVEHPFSHSPLRVRDFERAYKVIVPLLPFDYMELDGFERLKKVTAFLNGRPRSCQSVSKSVLYGPKVLNFGIWQSDRISSQELLYPNLYCLVSGWWPIYKSGHCNREYQNPNHYHQSQLEWVTDVADRARLFRQTARLGVLSDADVAPMIGHDCRGHVPDLCRQLTGTAWGELRTEGKVRLARTIKTIREWTGCTYAEVETAFGLPPRTAEWRIRHYAPDFWPPKDPSYRQNLEVVLAEARGDV